MGKKQKSRSSRLSSSQLLNDSKDSSFCSSSRENSQCERILPENFIVSSVEATGCDLYAKNLKSEWKDTVFLHPAIMRECSIEDLVLIKGEQKQILCVAYPVEKLKKNMVVFPKGDCPFKYQECVLLHKYEGEVKHANEIVVTFDDEKDVSESTKEYILRLLRKYEGEVKRANEIFVTFDEEKDVSESTKEYILRLLRKYEGEVKRANEIFVTFDEEKDVSESTKEYILRLLSNQYIFNGLEVKWKFFDRCYQCVVKSINCVPNVSRTNLIAAVPVFYTVSYKTSVKTIEYENKHTNPEIGGLQRELNLLNNCLQKFLNRSTYCGILLIDGPSGTGKSLLLQTVLNDYNIFTKCIIWSQLCAMSQSEVKQALEDVFQQTVDNVPSIIVIEEFNYLCPSKNEAENLHFYISKKISQFLKTLNDVKVMVIATVNKAEYDTSVLQQSGRLMEVIKFKIPTQEKRIDILNKLLQSCDHELMYEQIEICARLSHGFTGKDLMEVIKDAQAIACKREFSDVFDSREFFSIVQSRKDKIVIKYSDLHFCIKLKKKSIVTSGDIKVKKVHWSDIGGMICVKEKLKEIVEWPIKHAEAFKMFNISPCRGILMYGPPGCSKTMIAKALATECELNFISKNAADLYNKYVGESEKAVRDLFALAKAKSPCIIFLDEIDALVTGRESESGSSGVGNRIVTTLLTEMDGIEELHGVIIIAATNRPDMLDDALVRNGRINHFIYVSLPDATTREEIFKINMKNRTVSEDFDFKYLVEKTDGYSGAEIVNLCNEAALQLLAENSQLESPVFRVHHFEQALNYVLPRTNKEMVHFYETFNKKHCI